MTKRRTTSERIAELEKRESQICAQKKLLQKKEAEENRKARTKRLIMIGAEVEKILDSRTKTSCSLVRTDSGSISVP